mgnify:CR=1 FL=1
MTMSENTSADLEKLVKFAEEIYQNIINLEQKIINMLIISSFLGVLEMFCIFYGNGYFLFAIIVPIIFMLKYTCSLRKELNREIRAIIAVYNLYCKTLPSVKVSILQKALYEMKIDRIVICSNK